MKKKIVRIKTKTAYNLDLPPTQYPTVQNNENHNTSCNYATGSCSDDYNVI